MQQPDQASSDILLSAQGLSRRFGGLQAVKDVGFTVRRSTIKGIIGPNGAGKTTLFNLIAGSIKPDTGTVLLSGKPIQGLSPHRIAGHGLSRTFQNLKLFQRMTVLENVLIGCHTTSRGGMIAGMLNLPFTWREEKRVREKAMAMLERMHIADLADREVSALSFGQQRAVEMARALVSEPVILLLDEPAAGLNMQETVKVGEQIRAIRDMGITVLIVEHDVALIMEICDEIMVLCFGQKIADGTPTQVRANPEVIRVYLGDEAC